MNEIQLQQFNIIKQLAKDRGWELISERYVKNSESLIFKCSEGHIRDITGANFKKGRACAVCNNKCPKVAKERFEQQIKDMGGQIIGDYKNADTGIDCICKNGHYCCPRPSDIKQGQGMCKACVGQCPIEGERTFLERLEELGATIVGQYVNTHTPVDVICKNGHSCIARPSNIKSGEGICLKCAGTCPIESEKGFIEAIVSQGGKIIGKYVNNSTKVECVCKEAHTVFIAPVDAKGNKNMCNMCSGYTLAVSKLRFEKWIEEMGGKVFEEYVTNDTPLDGQCSKGHDIKIYPAYKNLNFIPCLLCKNHTENIIHTFLKSQYKNIKYQAKFKWLVNPETNHKLSFDFIIGNVVIELDGPHHFGKVHYWDSDFEKQFQRDILKMKIATERGFKFIRIYQPDIYLNKFDWKTQIIHSINLLQNTNTLSIWLSYSDKNVYDKHIEALHSV